MIARYGSTYGCLDLWRAAAAPDAEESLKSALADLHGVRHVFLFDSARAALYFLLRAYGRSGGGIVIPGYTCIVVPESVASAGYVPVFADIGDRSINMTPETLLRAVSPRTAGVVITHQFGLPCHVREIVEICRRRNLLAIEDAAASIGATVGGRRVGSFGDAAIVSFYHTKVIAAGPGGALLTNDDDLAARLSALPGTAGVANRNSCSDLCSAALWKLGTSRFLYPALRRARRLISDESTFGQVSPKVFAPGAHPRRCSPFVAALFRMQLDRLAGNLERRRHWAAVYSRELGSLPGFGMVDVPEGVLPSWIQYPVFVPHKSDLCDFALRRSVDLSWTFRYCAAESYGVTGLRNCMRAARTMAGLPTYPALTETAVLRICAVLQQYAAKAVPFASCAGASGGCP